MRSLCSLLSSMLAAMLLSVPGQATATSERVRDPGLVLELDLAEFRLRARDARSGEVAPALRVSVGSPAHPTPRGDFRLGRVILNPAWTPGYGAALAGAEPTQPSLDSPMGVAKIPFAQTGAIALHGGGDERLLGKPVSGGCVRSTDSDLLRLIAWIHERGALAPTLDAEGGEIERRFARPVRLRVR